MGRVFVVIDENKIHLQELVKKIGNAFPGSTMYSYYEVNHAVEFIEHHDVDCVFATNEQKHHDVQELYYYLQNEKPEMPVFILSQRVG